MGFGSYDESEHEEQEIEADEVDTENNERTEFEGDMDFESGADTDDLLDQLSEIKAEADEE